MRAPTVFDQVVDVVADLFDEKGETGPETRFYEDLEADSLNMLEFAFRLEDRFHLEDNFFTDEEIKGLVTVQDAVVLVERRLPAEPPSKMAG